MRFRFCPVCGNPLTLREAGDDGLTPYCVSCRKMWFDMFASCVIVLVANEYNEIALLHQPDLSERGVFVSGYITPGESAEEAAVREVREELGLEIEELESKTLSLDEIDAKLNETMKANTPMRRKMKDFAVGFATVFNTLSDKLEYHKWDT